MKRKKTNVQIARGSLEESRRAFTKLSARMEALDADGLLRVNVDLGRAVGVVLAAAPAIERLLPELEEQLPRFPITHVTELRDVALAAWYAHTIYSAEGGEHRRTETRSEEAVGLRRTLLVQAEALAERGLLDPDRVAEVRAGRTAVEVAEGLATLAQLYRAHWDRIAQKTPVSEAELDRAAILSTELLEARAARDRPPAMPGTAMDVVEARQRAFTLLAEVYDGVRRALTYLRWDEQDAETLAPSIYAVRGGRRAAPSPERTPSPESEPGDTAVPAPAGAADPAVPRVPVPA